MNIVSAHWLVLELDHHTLRSLGLPRDKKKGQWIQTEEIRQRGIQRFSLTGLPLNTYAKFTVSLSHLMTMLPESSSLPLPA